MITQSVDFLGSGPLFLPVGFYLTIVLMTITREVRKRWKKREWEKGGEQVEEKKKKDGTGRRGEGWGAGEGGGRKGKSIKKEEGRKRECILYNLNRSFWKRIYGLMLINPLKNDFFS